MKITWHWRTGQWNGPVYADARYFFDNEGFVFDNGRTAVIAIIPSDKGKPMFSERWRTNMKKKRVLSIVLAAAMITGMAAGCRK